MTAYYKNALINGILSDFSVEDGVFGDILPAGSLEKGEDLCGKVVIPGFIDIHTHGCLGYDTMEGHLEEMAKFHAKNGTTTLYPTTVTMSFDDIRKAVSQPIENLDGARIPGFHIEGPFIAEKYKGAQNPAFIAAPDADFIESLPNIKNITVAPERENAIGFIARMKEKGIHVAIGHTEADYDTAVLAIDAGADSLTHTCNAMPPLLHRAPGPIGAAQDMGIYAQVISDGVHLHPSMVRAVVKLFGKDKTVFISDAVRATGLDDGDYLFGGLNVYVRNGEARLQDGTLAGSTTLLLGCARTALSFGFSLSDVVRFTSENAARMMGLNRGRIEKGFDADFLVTDEKLANLDRVYIGGKRFS